MFPSGKSFVQVLGSGVAVNVSTFIILAVAPLLLSTNDFAKLSLSVAGTFFGSTLLDFGLSVSVVRQFAHSGDAAYLSLLVRTRLLLVLLLVPVGIPLIAIERERAWGVAVICAALLNLWNGLRTVDQGREAHASFARANFVFSLVRLISGGLALITGSWAIIASAIFAVPVVGVTLSRVRSLMEDARYDHRRVLWPAFQYSAFVYISALTYNACVYLPQAVAAARLDAVAVGSLGLASTVVAPLLLVNGALRVLMLPRISSARFEIPAQMMSPGFLLRAFGLLFGLVVAVLTVSIVIERIYGSRYPDIGTVCALLVGAYALAIPVGLMNMRVHKFGRPSLEAIVNVARLFIAAPILWLAGTNVSLLALAWGATILIGEIALFGAICAVTPPQRKGL